MILDVLKFFNLKKKKKIQFLKKIRNFARKIISGGEPNYLVDYSHVGVEPEEGETLFMIHYKFHQDKKMDGYRAFAGLSQEQDELDSGACRPLGR